MHHSGAQRAAGMLSHIFRCHAPPPGLAFGEPDDRLQRGIQHSRDAPAQASPHLEYWIARSSRATTPS